MSEFDTSTTAVADITGDYTIDASHSSLAFTARHAMVTKVRGQFRDFTGTATIDTAEPKNSQRQPEHPGRQHRHRQRRPQRPPELRRLLRRREQPRDHLRLHRRLARRQRLDHHRRPDHQGHRPSRSASTFEETGSARDPFGNLRVGFEGAVTVNRKDWGLTWNAALETGGVLVSEKVKLEFDISAIKTPDRSRIDHSTAGLP